MPRTFFWKLIWNRWCLVNRAQVKQHR